MRNRAYPYYSRPDIATVVELLEILAESAPDSAAFRFRAGKDRTEEKSHLDVLRDVRRLAGRIGEPGRHIAILGENSYAWLVAFLAILSSGNVAVPIDKDLPAAEVAALLRNADVSAAFVSGAYADLTEGAEGLTVLPLKRTVTEGEEPASSVSLLHPDPEAPACIFFTSGTSGVSKGVVLTHANLAAEISRGAMMVDLENKTVFSVLPFHHTFGLIVSVFIPYIQNAAIYLCSSLKRLKEELLLARPECLPVVPLFVEVLHKQITEGIQKKGKEKSFRLAVRLSRLLLRFGVDLRRRLFREILAQLGGNLEYIICGGAFLDPAYIGEFRDLGVEIINAYGATECSPGIAINRNHHHRDGSTGLLLPGVEARISPGGEIQIRGPIVMKEYYKNPEETARALHDGWYSTGDLGYLDRDGFLFLTGRIKNLIILSNGENISPEELENDFRQDSGVQDVLVYGDGSSIVAEIYPEPEWMGREDYFRELMQKVNRGRPAYKQVRRIVLRDQDFIRNTSRKIIRGQNTGGRSGG